MRLFLRPEPAKGSSRPRRFCNESDIARQSSPDRGNPQVRRVVVRSGCARVENFTGDPCPLAPSDPAVVRSPHGDRSRAGFGDDRRGGESGGVTRYAGRPARRLG